MPDGQTDAPVEVRSDLRGRTALVTGAGTGMGAATALLFAERGARVVVADVNDESGGATVEAIQSQGGEAHYVRADVSSEEDVRAMVATAVEVYGRLDCAVNNAAVPPDSAPIADLDLAVFDRVISVDLRGVALCLKYEIRQFLAQGGPAAVVNVGSVSSVRARPHNAAYVAAKHGVVGLTKVAAIEYGAQLVRVNAVLPGAIDTPMIRAARAAAGTSPADEFGLSLFGRLGTPREVAEASLWLCSDRSSYVTGHCLAVDAGYLAR